MPANRSHHHNHHNHHNHTSAYLVEPPRRAHAERRHCLTQVYAENVLTGKKRLTNTARAWYVAKPFQAKGISMVDRLINKIQQDPRKSLPGAIDVEDQPVLPVPSMTYPSEKAVAEGLNRYEHQKQQRACVCAPPGPFARRPAATARDFFLL